jgi:hypothetical protein
MTVITREAAIASLRKAVEKNGADFIYFQPAGRACSYSENGEPSCIVGHVIADLAPELFEKFRASEETDNSGGSFTINNAPRELRAEVEDTFTAAALRTLRYAQMLQDERGTWGAALAAAEATAA